MKGEDVAMASIVQYNDWLEEEVNMHFHVDHKSVSVWSDGVYQSKKTIQVKANKTFCFFHTVHVI